MAEDHFLSLHPGTIVNGRYEIERCLGTGSMGMVYACKHRELGGHKVAMKVLFSEVARDEVAAARFKNEIVAAYGVSHPNVVRAYEYFRDGDLIAFTMEYIGGGDLADKLNSENTLSIYEISKLLYQMCSGVQAIHDAGIVHRDLKPENILITVKGDIKITDFGIARTGTGPKLTEHGGVVGTIDYVSPEYLERGQVDGRSDIYSMGVLAYEMITGQAPFKGNSVIETMTLRLKKIPERPEVLRPDCPKELSDIVIRALEKDPMKRYQKSSDMQNDLIAFIQSGKASKEVTKKVVQKKPPRRYERESLMPKNTTFPKTPLEPSFDFGSEPSLGELRSTEPKGLELRKGEERFDKFSSLTRGISTVGGGSFSEKYKSSTRMSSESLAQAKQTKEPISKMEAHINGELERAVEEANDVSYKVEQMESVLSPTTSDRLNHSHAHMSTFSMSNLEARPGVSEDVSKSHLNAYKINQLSAGGHTLKPKSNKFGAFLAYAVIVILGFTAGFLILGRYFPSVVANNPFLQGLSKKTQSEDLFSSD